MHVAAGSAFLRSFERTIVRFLSGFILCKVGENCHLSRVFRYRNPNGTVGGELDLGGIDSSHFTGTIHYVPLKSDTYWLIEGSG